ncbi:MAG TPA: FlgD immunoglobulin-like domain containing protein, partial [Candidatus Eisenbacteria bacterium]
DPTGDPPAWNYRGRLASMIGIDTRSWYASEHLLDGTHDIFGFVNYNRIEMYQMLWTAPDAFQLYEPGNFHVVSLTWSQSPVVAGGTTTLSVVATGWLGQSVQLQAAEALPGGGTAPLPIDALGIPSSLPLTADTTSFVWTANILHADGSTTGPESIVVQTSDLTATASPLEVVPPPPPLRVTGMAWSQTSMYAGGTATLNVAATGWAGHSIALAAAEHTPAGVDSALSLSDLGLPATLPLTADTTRLAWVARIRRASGDTTTAQFLRVGTADDSVVAGLLYLTAAETIDPLGGGIDPDPIRLHFRLLSSSVFGRASAFLIDLPHPARVRLDVYDLQGRRVRNLADRELPAGANVLPWDGRDANGAAAERGLYFARLVTPGLVRTVKVVLTRPGGAP